MRFSVRVVDTKAWAGTDRLLISFHQVTLNTKLNKISDVVIINVKKRQRYQSNKRTMLDSLIFKMFPKDSEILYILRIY